MEIKKKIKNVKRKRVIIVLLISFSILGGYFLFSNDEIEIQTTSNLQSVSFLQEILRQQEIIPVGNFPVHPYGMQEDGKFCDNTGLCFANQSDGYFNIYEGDILLRRFGFGITTDQANRTVADFGWTWEFNSSADTWTATHEGATFTWIQTFEFNRNSKMKITHYVENNWQNLTSTKLWYIFTINPEETVFYDGRSYDLDIDRHITQNISDRLYSVKFPTAIFDFTDVASNYNLTDLYVGEANFFDSATRIFGLGISNKVGGGNFRLGQNVTVDPTITIEDVSLQIGSILTNITAESNFTHLTIGDATVGTINDTNLILYMPFDVNISSTTTYDYSALDNDGTLVGDVHFVDEGIIGGAYVFDGGTDYIERTSLSGFSGENFTILAWARTNAASTAYGGIVGYTINVKRYEIFLDPTGDFGISYNDSAGSAKFRESTSNSDDNNWHHFVGGFNGSSFLFIDGSQIIEAGEQGGSTGLTNTLRIGSLAHSGGFYFNGTIDEVMILNRSMNPSEINATFHNQSSRFFPQGSQEFQTFDPLKASGDDTINVTISTNSSTPFDSLLEFRVGTLTSTDNYTTDTLPHIPEFWFRFDNSTGENSTFMRDFGSRSMNVTCTDCGGNIKSTERYFQAGSVDSNTWQGTDEDIIANITILAWINKTETSSGNIIIKSDGAVANGEWEFIINAAEVMDFDCGGSTDTSTGGTVNGEWSFVGVSFNEGTGNIVWYLNGARDSIDTNADTCLIDDTESVVVSNQLTGEIDDIMVFERILTDAEVNEIYTKGGFNYGYTGYQALNNTNTTATFPIPTNTNYTLIEARMTTGDGIGNSFITPNLVGNIDIITFIGAIVVPPGPLCIFSCVTNDTISVNTNCDGEDLILTGPGNISINANITNWDQTIITDCQVSVEQLLFSI